jgi:tetratricopeptide (TPR) repeat protein
LSAGQPEQILRLFVSSPGDVADERRRVEIVVERLNAEFKGRVRIEAVRWETEYYSAHDTFQKQIPEASGCDVVVAIFRARLGTELPADFPRLPTGEPYPSGTAYEVLSAIEARKARHDLPDIYVFRYPRPPSIQLDDPHEAQIRSQWERLKAFFDTWFKTTGGQFVAAFQDFASTDDFAEKLESCLRQWLAKRGYTAEGPAWDRLLDGSPFPGLGAFDAKRERVFFGRGLATAQAAARLRDAAIHGTPFLLLIGASGSGKSSFLRAGLAPYLTRPGTIPEIDLWRNALVEVGPDPLLSLAEALFAETGLGAELRQGDFRTAEALAALFAGGAEAGIAPVRGALERAAQDRAQQANFAAPRPARLLLAIDQAERLFLEASPEAASAFVAIVVELIKHQLAYVIVALRSDAYPRFQLNDALRDLRETGATFDLVPPAAGELEEIVTRPVAACHPPLAFELENGRSLASVLVADARGGDTLPLLQMTLSRLFDAEAGRGDGLLRYADYPGINAAVTKTAEDALAHLDADARAQVPALVTALVRDVVADPLTGAPIPSVGTLDRAAFERGHPARTALADAFVTRRLLTVEGAEGAIRLRPVHEALLRIWPEAVRIVAENASLIRVRYALEPIVRNWQEAVEAERARHLDISPALLGGAQQLLARFGQDLPAPMQDFIAQSSAADAARRGREHRRQRAVLAATVGALVVVASLALAATWQWHSAEQARQEAQLLHDRADEAVTKFLVSTVSLNRDDDGAIKELDQAILLAPADATGYFFRGLAYQKRSDSDHAIADFTKAIALNPKLAFAYAFRGALYNEKKDFDRSLADLNRMIELNTTHAPTYNDLGWAYYNKQDYDRATANYDQAIRLDPTNAEYYDRRGDVYRAMGNFDRAVADYTEAIRLNPKFAAAYNDRGLAYNDKGDYDRAIADYTQAIGLDRTSSDYHDNRGDAYRNKGDYDRAIADYTQAIKLNPKDAVAYGDRGWAYLNNGDHARAIADFSEAIKLDPSNASTFSARGLAYAMMGDSDRAILDYDQAIKLDPANVVAFNGRGLAYSFKGEYDRAILDYSEALRLDADNVLALDNRADAYNDKGDYDRAVADFDQLIRLAPTNGVAWKKRCFARAVLGLMESALADCNEALRLQPEDAATLGSRGFTYLKLGRFADAIADYDAALRLDPQLAASLYGRGLAKLKQGQAEGGNTDIAAAKAIDNSIAEQFARYGVL